MYLIAFNWNRYYFLLYYSLGAIHADAYEAYQTSHNLKAVIEKACSLDPSKIVNNKNGKMNVNLSLLTPILPMLVSYLFTNYFVS